MASFRLLVSPLIPVKIIEYPSRLVGLCEGNFESAADCGRMTGKPEGSICE
jgi:hypothetical protein